MAIGAILIILMGLMIMYIPIFLYNSVSTALMIGGGILTFGGMFLLFNNDSGEKRVIGPVIATILVAIPLFFIIPGANQKNEVVQAKEKLRDAIIDRAAKICAEKTNESIKLDKKAGTKYPIVVLVDDANRTPAEWLPKSVEDLQLVACGTKSQDVIQTCKYTESSLTNSTGKYVGTLKRVQEQVSFTIYDVNSGKKVDQVVVDGDSPTTCPEKQTFQENEREKEFKGVVTKGIIINSLGKFYNP